MKAQSAVEYLILIGMVLLIITPLAAYIWQQNEIGTRLRQGQIAVNSIAATADNIYAQGSGAKTTVGIVFPSGYRYSESNLANKTIQIRVVTPAGYNDLVATTKANVTGSLPTTSGYKLLKFELTGGYVNITSSD